MSHKKRFEILLFVYTVPFLACRCVPLGTHRYDHEHKTSPIHTIQQGIESPASTTVGLYVAAIRSSRLHSSNTVCPVCPYTAYTHIFPCYVSSLSLQQFDYDNGVGSSVDRFSIDLFTSDGTGDCGTYVTSICDKESIGCKDSGKY